MPAIVPNQPYTLLGTLSESRLIPTRHHLSDFTAEEVAVLAYLYLIGLRILLLEPATSAWAKRYCRKTAQDKFSIWMTDGTDLYNLLYALVDQDVALKHPHESDAFRRRLRVLDPLRIRRWLEANATATTNEGLTTRLFVNLDAMFRISDSSMRAVRRLVQDWPELPRQDRRFAMTRLLQFLRHRTHHHSELLPQLIIAAQRSKLELHHVCDQETGHGCPESKSGPSASHGFGFLAGLAHGVGQGRHRQHESATAGATSAAAIATVATPLGGVIRRPILPVTRSAGKTKPRTALGVGFDPDGNRGIYG